VDVVAFIEGLTLFDILVVFFVAGFFVVGYIQGTLRRLLGLGSRWSLLLALNLRDPLGPAGAVLEQLPGLRTCRLGGAPVIFLGSITVQTLPGRSSPGRPSSTGPRGILGALRLLWWAR
jgi:hypothetical protein